MDTIIDYSQEQSKLEITNELRWFIEVDSRKPVKIGGLEKKSEAIMMVRPKFNKTGRGKNTLFITSAPRASLATFSCVQQCVRSSVM